MVTTAILVLFGDHAKAVTLQAPSFKLKNKVNDRVILIVINITMIKILIQVIVSYLSVSRSTCNMIGQFSRPYFIVQPPKFKSLLELKYLTKQLKYLLKNCFLSLYCK